MRRLRLWKILLGALGLFVLTIAALWARFELKWMAMKSLSRQLAEEAAARDSRRPSVLGRDVPGNAWDDYSAGLAALRTVVESLEGQFSPVLESKAVELDDDAERVLTLLQPSFENLRQGASRAESRYPADWTKADLGYSGELSALAWERKWVYAALHEHRRLSAQSDLGQALELLLATMQFAMDVGRNAREWNFIVSASWLDQMRQALLRLLSDPRLRNEDLLEIERSAAQAEAWIPAVIEPAFRNNILGETIRLGGGDVERLVGLGFEVRLQPTWRHAWCLRYYIADAVLKQADWSDRLARSVALPLAEAEAAWIELQEARTKSGNVYAERYGKGTEFDYAIYVKELRVEIAEWRLVRAAAAFRRTGEVPSLEDPFGATLKSRVEGKAALIWSLGPDLLDADGVAGKSYREGDLVLEIRR